MCACVCVFVYICLGRSKFQIRCLPLLLSSFPFEIDYLPKLEAYLFNFWLAWLPRESPVSVCLCLPLAPLPSSRITGVHHNQLVRHPDSHSHRKCVAHCTASPVPIHILVKLSKKAGEKIQLSCKSLSPLSSPQFTAHWS